MLSTDGTRGFFTIAQNTKNVDYVKLAYGLALSLKHSQTTVTNISIGITPGTTVDPRYKWAFDQIIEIPWGDNAASTEWKLENEWKTAWMSPYDETIKLDCDMLFLNDISTWWENLANQDQDLVFANQVLDWRGDLITSDHCRKVFTENHLPNIYSAFMYFRKSSTVYDFFELAKLVTWNWERFFEMLLEPQSRPQHFSTDVAFSLVMKILDLDQCSYATRVCPTFTHMKSQIQNWQIQSVSDNWMDHLTAYMSPSGSFKIGNHRQVYPLHYHVKEFLTDDKIKTYENLVKK